MVYFTAQLGKNKEAENYTKLPYKMLFNRTFFRTSLFTLIAVSVTVAKIISIFLIINCSLAKYSAVRVYTLKCQRVGTISCLTSHSTVQYF